MEDNENNDDSYFEIEGNLEKIKDVDISGMANKNQITEAPSEDVFITQKLEIQKIKEKIKESKFRINNKIKTKEVQTIKKIEHSPSDNSKKNNVIKKVTNLVKKNNNNNNVLIPENIIKIKHINKSPNVKQMNKTYNNYIRAMSNNIQISGNILKQNVFNSSINSLEKIRNLRRNNTSNYNKILTYNLEDTFFFEITRANKEKSSEDNHIPQIKNNWSPFLPDLQNPNGIEFNKFALRSKYYNDYNMSGVEVNLHINLIGESQCFISTRSFVSLNNNENIFEPSDRNVKIFNKFSNLIMISKIINSNKVFVSFGTFCQSKKTGKIFYKFFLKRQLVNFMQDDNNYYYLENDLCELDIHIRDLGNEFLQANISLNNKNRFNNIKGNFYLPLNHKAKFLFCGGGDSVRLMNLNIKTIVKNENEFLNQTDMLLTNSIDNRKKCDCCSVV